MSGWRGIRYTDLKKSSIPAGRGMGRRTAAAGDSAPAGDAPPIFFLRHQKENAPRPVEKKKCLGGSVCAGADLLPPAGEGWQSRAAVRDGNARPLGNLSARGSPGYTLRRFSLPLAGQLMKVSSRANAIASTTARAARSEAERAEREAGQMRSCTPTPSAPSATGRQYRPHRRPKRARMPGKIGAGTGTPTPVRAEGHCTGARPAPFSLTPGAARSLFGATKKRMGGALPSWHPS